MRIINFKIIRTDLPLVVVVVVSIWLIRHNGRISGTLARFLCLVISILRRMFSRFFISAVTIFTISSDWLCFSLNWIISLSARLSLSCRLDVVWNSCEVEIAPWNRSQNTITSGKRILLNKDILKNWNKYVFSFQIRAQRLIYVCKEDELISY